MNRVALGAFENWALRKRERGQFPEKSLLGREFCLLEESDRLLNCFWSLQAGAFSFTIGLVSVKRQQA